MAGIDVERQDPLTFFRAEVSPADLARARAEWEVQRQSDANSAAVLMILLGILILVVASGVVMQRRKIARAADAAIVSGLATGVRAARKVASKRDALIKRILAKADEKPSKPD